VTDRDNTSLTLNGAPISTAAATLDALLKEQGYAGKVATARNGTFVPERARAGTQLEAGDTIEVVSARPGG
jgi:sulfur carrier protein